jgi:hypothetical protein
MRVDIEHGLTARQERAIVALLEHPSVADATAAAGVSQPTLWRWMQQAGFREAYRSAQRRAVEAAIANLQQASAEAVGALRRNLTCGRPAVEVRAAEVILDLAFRGHELLDLATRIEQLEAAVEERQARREAS